MSSIEGADEESLNDPRRKSQTAAGLTEADYNIACDRIYELMHSTEQAIEPVWESKSDWDTFKEIAKATSKRTTFKSNLFLKFTFAILIEAK